MASPSVARRAPRREIESDDVVMMRAAELAEWARKNARAVMYTTAAVLLAVVGVLYYNVYKSQRAERAATAYLQLQAGLPNDTTAQTIRTLQNFTTQYPGTTEADEARIAAAQILLSKGDAAHAITAVRPAADGGTPVSLQARFVLGAALAQAGKRQEAISTYQDLAGDAKLAYLKRDALNQVALLREQGNDWKGAAEVYTQMLDGLDKGTAERQIVELHLAEAQARAGLAPAAK